jgi:membrane protein CcdC involved in cytochrome C biogenesis
MSNPIEIVLIIAVIGYVLLRRMAGQPAQGKKLLILPAVIMVIGITSLGHTWSPLSVGFLVATTAMSFVLGIFRGVSIKLFEKDGIVWMKYTKTTVALWIGNIAIKVVAAVALAAIDPTAAHQESTGLLISLGMGILMEGIVVSYKAVNSNLSSRVVWAKGKDGEADRVSPFFDNLQKNGTSSLLDSIRDRSNRR